MREQTLEVDQASRLREIALRSAGRETAFRPYCMTVTSGKGGVGKSTVALNLALALCELGRKVLLVDADSNLGNLDVLIGIAPAHRLGDVLRGRIDIEDALVDPYPNLKLLPGSSGDVEYPEMTAIVQQRFLEDLFALEEKFDVIIIDTSAGLSKEVVSYSLESDETIVVTSVEPTSVMDSYAVIKTITISKPEHRISVLMNAVQIPAQADDTVKKLRLAVDHFLKREIDYLGSVPFDKNMRIAVLAQEPVLTKYPASAVSLTLKSAAREVLSQLLVSDQRAHQ